MWVAANNTTASAFKDEINKLDPRKAGIEKDIPTKILISSSNTVCTDNAYPQILKLADVTSIHKMDAHTIIDKLSPSKYNSHCLQII